MAEARPEHPLCPAEASQETLSLAGRSSAPGDGAKGEPRAGDARESGAPPHRVFEMGQLVAGRFRVEGWLGEGGMGQVYRAHDLELGHGVALKTIHPRVAHRPGMLERFRREVQLARRITHGNVCRLFDVFWHHDAASGDGSTLVLSMELVEGQALDGWLRRRGEPLSPEAARPLIEQLLAGLAAAHRAGVVHRDLKTANLLLSESLDRPPRLVLTDFGLALESDTPGPTRSAGTPAYMAPEQIVGEPPTPAMDVWACGVILHEMLTGRRPRPDDIALEGLPPAWRGFIDQCLVADPGRRLASAQAMREALPPKLGRWKRSATARWLTAAALLALAVGEAHPGQVWRQARDRGESVSRQHLAAGEGEQQRLERHHLAAADALEQGELETARDALVVAESLAPSDLETGLRLAQVRLDLAETAQAMALLDRLEGHPEGADEPRLPLLRARAMARVGDFTSQLALARRALHRVGEPTGAGSSSLLAEASLLEGAALGELGRGSEALPAIVQARDAFIQIGDRHGEARVLAAEARLIALGQVDVGRAEQLYRRALDTFRQLDDERAMARTCIALADTLLHQGRVEDAEILMAETGDLARQLDAKAELAELHRLGAHLASLRQDTRRAAAMAHQALILYRGLGDRAGQAHALATVGITQLGAGAIDDAVDSFGQAIDLARETGQRHRLARTQINLAITQIVRGEMTAGEELLGQAIGLGEAIDDPGVVAAGRTHLGQLAAARLEIPEALAEWRRAEGVLRRLDDGPKVVALLDGIGNLEMYRARFAEAGQSFENCIDLAESLDLRALADTCHLKLANLALYRGRPSEAEERLGKLLDRAETLGLRDHPMAEILMAEAVAESDPSRARQHLGRALTLPRPSTDLARLDLALAEAHALLALGELERARFRCEETLGLTPPDNPLQSLESELLDARLDLLSGEPDARPRLRELRDRAESHGLHLLVRQAEGQLAPAAP